MSDATTSEFRELPTKFLSEDSHQPRESFNVDGDQNRLKLSIQQLGIQQPIAVMKTGTNSYQLIDGHRRFRCAVELGISKIPCRIYQKLEPGELERVRFELQNNRRLWKPLERASAISNFKKSSGVATNKEAAEKLFISETLISNSVQLGNLRAEYKELMDTYGLAPSYQIEFIKLQPKLRPIEEFTVEDITKTLFKRVSHQVIRTSKDFRTLGRIFLRATANHKQIYAFLKDEDMPITELEEKTLQSGFSLLVEQSIKKIKANEEDGRLFSAQEKMLLNELRKELDKALNKKSKSTESVVEVEE